MEKPTFFTKTAVVAKGKKIGAKHGLLFCSGIVNPNVVSSAFKLDNAFSLKIRDLSC
jgi:hypothetical protein